MSLAERVREERGIPDVGYAVRGDVSWGSRLNFVTVGIALKSFEGSKCVIVDEVHERGWMMDLLLVKLKRALAADPKLKVVMMSATLDGRVAGFFGEGDILEIEGRTFPVKERYLEDLVEAGLQIDQDYYVRPTHTSGTASVRLNKGGVRSSSTVSYQTATTYDNGNTYDYAAKGYGRATQEAMRKVDEFKVNVALIADVCARFLEESEDGGSALVFLPGAGEIRDCHGVLVGDGRMRGVKVLMLHSNVSAAQQRECFAPGRKIILSTNIAEASLTLPDVTCVIDTGLSREVGVSSRSGTGTLRKSWCSRASAKQRAGRAGRVRPGVCYRLYSRWTWEGRMKDHLEPEIRRMPLEEVVVAVLEGGRCSVEGFLSECPDPPEKGVKEAVDGLVHIGAVRVLDKGGEALTRLGRCLVRLNVPCRVGKVVLFSVLLKCVRAGLGIAALMAVGKSPFLSDEGAAAAQVKRKFWKKEAGGSDFAALAEVWRGWKEGGRAFCRENFLSWNVLRDAKVIEDGMLTALVEMGWIGRGEEGLAEVGENDSNFDVVNGAVAAGLGNFARWTRRDGKKVLVWRGEEVTVHSSSGYGKGWDGRGGERGSGEDKVSTLEIEICLSDKFLQKKASVKGSG